MDIDAKIEKARKEFDTKYDRQVRTGTKAAYLAAERARQRLVELVAEKNSLEAN